MGRGRPHQLESERRPVVFGIPDQDWQEQQHRDQRRRPGIGTRQPAPAPVRHQHECEHGRNQHHRGEFRQQRQACEQARGQPPARIVAFGEPNQRPHHRHRERNQRHVGRDLGHQQSVVKCGLRHQQRQHDAAEIMRDPADDIGQQQLRGQHRQDAGEPHAQIGIAEDRSAEADEPGDHRRMVEEGERALLRPGPVIGLVGAQFHHAGIDQAKHRHRGNHSGNGQPSPQGGAVRFRAASIGRG